MQRYCPKCQTNTRFIVTGEATRAGWLRAGCEVCGYWRYARREKMPYQHTTLPITFLDDLIAENERLTAEIERTSAQLAATIQALRDARGTLDAMAEECGLRETESGEVGG